MKPKLKHLAAVGLLLLPVAAIPTPRVSAGVQPVATPVASIQSAPALVQDSAEALRRSLLARLEFEELDLQLVGVARFGDETACTIKQPNSPDPMLYRSGDVVGGYRIVAIDQTSVTFERNDHKFYLTAGENSNGMNIAESEGYDTELATANHAATAPAGAPTQLIAGPALDHNAEAANIVLKTAAEDLKHKTRRFDTAKLIEEVTSDKSGSAKLHGSRAGSIFALPLDGRFTSPFGYRRHPLGGGIKFHRGIDLAADYGTIIHASAPGVVEKSAWTPTLGNYVSINHGNGYTTRYGHMSRRLVSEGDKVGQGDPIGRVGSTGQSTGNHVHFEIRKNDVALDPENFVRVGRHTSGESD